MHSIVTLGRGQRTPIFALSRAESIAPMSSCAALSDSSRTTSMYSSLGCGHSVRCIDSSLSLQGCFRF